MSENTSSQATTLTIQDNAHVKGTAVGNQNKLITDAEADIIVQADHSQVTVNVQQNTQKHQEIARLREAYLNWLLKTCGQVMLSGIDRKNPEDQSNALKLSGIYTALLTISADETRQLHEEREDKRLSAVAQLNRHNRLVLLGDPGSGKSTFINFVTLCMAGEMLKNTRTADLRSAKEADQRSAIQRASLELLTEPLPVEKEDDKEQPKRQPWEHGVLLPVRVILRDFAAEGLPAVGQTATAKHLWDFIVTTLNETLLADYADHLKTYLLDHGGLILLDGLDEVPEANARRVQIKQAVEDFAAMFWRCRIVVTSRTYAYQNQEWRLTDFAETRLAPFTKPQIIRFVTQWYAQSAELLDMRPDDAQARAEALKRALLGNTRLYEFAQRPLLLTLMASLHAWRGGTLPEKREELYDDAVELLLDWWESRKVKSPAGRFVSLSEALGLGREGLHGLLRAISKLAFDAHAAQPDLLGVADIPGKELAVALRPLTRQTNCNPTLLETYLRDRAGLLIEHGVDVYTFPHRTFQEYLAACHVTNQEDFPDNIVALARSDPNRWREVTLLSGARFARNAVGQIWTFAEALCYEDYARTADLRSAKEADQRSALQKNAWGALLAAQALTETAKLENISPRNQPKVERIKHWLVAILTEQVPAGQPFPAVERALAGNLLAVLDDPRPGIGIRTDGLPDIAWIDIPAGTFLMGSDPKKDKNAMSREQPQHRVTFKQPFQISRYPVTNAQYQAFVQDGGTRNAKYGGAFDLPNHPVVGVSWDDAVAFCKWLTQRLQAAGELAKNEEIRLPTEAEWEKAARGDDGRIYPWGNEDVTPEHANYGETGLGTTSAVGCFPRGASPFGCEDMAGNVWEWCQDVWHDNYKNAPPDGRAWEKDDDIDKRLLRGASYRDDAVNLRCANRNRFYLVNRVVFRGFRLARAARRQYF